MADYIHAYLEKWSLWSIWTLFGISGAGNPRCRAYELGCRRYVLGWMDLVIAVWHWRLRSYASSMTQGEP